MVWNVATYDKLLRLVDPIFNPCSAPFADSYKESFRFAITPSRASSLAARTNSVPGVFIVRRFPRWGFENIHRGLTALSFLAALIAARQR
jgi:hypothetical protein